MKKITTFCLSLLALTLSSAFIIKDDPFTALLKKLEEFTKKYPTENVHLHLDKPYYAIGDDIWFKAYVTDSRTTAPSTMSTILYVELIDESDSLKSKLLLPIKNGITWGDFKLPDSLSEGNYRIRAYTQLMRNAGPDFFFDKTIKIGNSWANKVFVKADYLFSTEGSNEKINSTLRFTDKNEKPYANAELNYVAELGAKIIAKGKLATNSNGEVNIPLINTQPSSSPSGKITATLTLPDKQKVTKIIPLKSTSAAVDVQFFAESGSLVQNLPNKLAFKAINSEGKSEDITGVIVDNDGTEITNFETSHLGMGSLSINPMSGKTYQAKVKFKNGIEKVVNLPKIESSGYVLSVNTSDTNKIAVKVLLSEDLVGKDTLQLLAQQNGKISFSVKISTAKNFAVANLPKSELPSGISVLTLFNAKTIPVAERLIFVNNAFDKIKIDIGNLKENYAKRAAVILDLKASNEAAPTQGSFSIAVTNASAVEPDLENETNIFTSLLLKSELKGYIEKPNSYFMADDVKTRANLDHLLLTQGWRKIDWNAIVNELPVINSFRAEKGLKISGTVTTLGGKPVANSKVSLFTTSMGVFAIDTLTDYGGEFNFRGLDFSDSTKFVINSLTEKGKGRTNAQVKLDVIPRQRITDNQNFGDIEINVNDQLKNYLQNSDDYFIEQMRRGALTRTIQLDKVNIIGQKKQQTASSSLAGAGRADAVYTAKDLKNANSLVDFLVSKTRLLLLKGSPTIVIDGMIMPFSLSASSSGGSGGIGLDGYSAENIASIEVLQSASNTSIYGIRGGNGVIVITSKQGGYTPEDGESTNPITYYPKGYAIPRQFYSPRYDTQPDNKPDLRTTVYWNPSVVSNEEGKFKLDYFNTDKPGLYRIVIEGIDMMGNLARKTFTYEVK